MKERPCREVARLLWQFIDQELDPATTRELAQHVRDCHGCGPRAEFEMRLRAIIQEKCVGEPAPERLRLRVLALLREL
ncbi:MAG TPA: mycothiol system anti-sigma-R factor [bacterium]|jgi:mycothiol system anti-sigma-R factor|nr:mycothiol system anti-sigma-R factor [bacterium]